MFVAKQVAIIKRVTLDVDNFQCLRHGELADDCLTLCLRDLHGEPLILPRYDTFAQFIRLRLP